MDRGDGRRELLAADPDISCNQPVPLGGAARAARPPEPGRLPPGDGHVLSAGCLRRAGPGRRAARHGEEAARRRARATARPASAQRQRGPGGRRLGQHAHARSATARGTSKTVLGEAQVYEDGSAFFALPARTPVYFQALDEKGTRCRRCGVGRRSSRARAPRASAATNRRTDAPPAGRSPALL